MAGSLEAHTKFSSSSDSASSACSSSSAFCLGDPGGAGQQRVSEGPVWGSRPGRVPHLLTSAAAWVAHADRAAQEAGGLAQVARGDVGDIVVATELLALIGGHRAWRRATNHAVRAARLVYKAGLWPRALHALAGLCGRGAGSVTQITPPLTTRKPRPLLYLGATPATSPALQATSLSSALFGLYTPPSALEGHAPRGIPASYVTRPWRWPHAQARPLHLHPQTGLLSLHPKSTPYHVPNDNNKSSSSGSTHRPQIWSIPISHPL